jgi:hypothetical protein
VASQAGGSGQAADRHAGSRGHRFGVHAQSNHRPILELERTTDTEYTILYIVISNFLRSFTSWGIGEARVCMHKATVWHAYCGSFREAGEALGNHWESLRLCPVASEPDEL